MLLPLPRTLFPTPRTYQVPVTAYQSRGSLSCLTPSLFAIYSGGYVINVSAPPGRALPHGQGKVSKKEALGEGGFD